MTLDPLFLLLRTVFEDLLGSLRRELPRRGFDDLHSSQYVFFEVARDGASPSELAADLKLSKQSVNHLLGQLQDRGYVLRDEGQDARSRRVHLTEKGHAAAAAIRSILDGYERRWAEDMGEKDLDSLLSTLARMVRILEEG
ncbi:MAG: MarR family transcriptional regulator [Deltaproteobacteria bacterium]|nr:MarR family transcriptional regulator [Deltaproteobacteria bacterium]